ncbi:MAG: heavy metal-responsive transcriptional regulator [Opitutaceae bacterium]
MTIGELSKKAGVSVEAIRYYEREGILPRAYRWSDNNYRDFDEDALMRLKFVRSAKDSGFTLREIRKLMDLNLVPGEACADVEKMIDQKLEVIESRIGRMRRLEANLVEMQKACRAGLVDGKCPALWQFSASLE